MHNSAPPCKAIQSNRAHGVARNAWPHCQGQIAHMHPKTPSQQPEVTSGAVAFCMKTCDAGQRSARPGSTHKTYTHAHQKKPYINEEI